MLTSGKYKEFLLSTGSINENNGFRTVSMIFLSDKDNSIITPKTFEGTISRCPPKYPPLHIRAS